MEMASSKKISLSLFLLENITIYNFKQKLFKHLQTTLLIPHLLTNQ